MVPSKNVAPPKKHPYYRGYRSSRLTVTQTWSLTPNTVSSFWMHRAVPNSPTFYGLMISDRESRTGVPASADSAVFRHGTSTVLKTAEWKVRCSVLGEEQEPRYRVTLAHHTAERRGERAINPSLCDPSRQNPVHPVPRDRQSVRLPDYTDAPHSKVWINKQIKFGDFLLPSYWIMMTFVLPLGATTVYVMFNLMFHHQLAPVTTETWEFPRNASCSSQYWLLWKKLEIHSFTFKFQKFLCRVRDNAPLAERSEAVFLI